MREDENLVLLYGEDKTSQIKFLESKGNKTDVYFCSTEKTYEYNSQNVIFEKLIQIVDAKDINMTINGEQIVNASKLLNFGSCYKIIFINGESKIYPKDDLQIGKNNPKRNLLDYFISLSEKIGIITESGKSLLREQYREIETLYKNSPLFKYLYAEECEENKELKNKEIVFPFGCNESQIKAVENSLSKQISVIEGPPGTGKTQTILNIIANAIIDNKTVAVVSNNNSATNNVYEKLENYGLEFIAARLGRSQNKREFVEEQSSRYPLIDEYKIEIDEEKQIKKRIKRVKEYLKDRLKLEEKNANLKLQLSNLKIEKEYFEQYYKENGFEDVSLRNLSILHSKQMLKLWNECERFCENQRRTSLLFRIKSRVIYGIGKFSLYSSPTKYLIPIYQRLFYITKNVEIEKEIYDLEELIKNLKLESLIDELKILSMELFKSRIYKKYGAKTSRPIFDNKDLKHNYTDFIKEYPVVLSTTYSIKTSLNSEFIYDYLIIDEASQVDLISGVLALSCAKNVVIVGDLMQLPNVVDSADKLTAKQIGQEYNIDEKYSYENNSLLSSICKVIPSVTKTLLKEHYRCHPKIIDFCNKKFYSNQLIIMTKDDGENDVLKAVKTVEGNHARGHINQRQIDEIEINVLPEIISNVNKENIGIISPYRDQAINISEKEFAKGIDTSTVHKFQGREKQAIIITTVDNEISDFTSNPNLLNVAISRAKRYLRLLVSDNEKNENTGIGDLIKYIEYNNFEVKRSNVYSTFDLLYKCRDEERRKKLRDRKRVSEFDSENLMYTDIKELLNKENYKLLDVVAHVPAKQILRNIDILISEEKKYINNSWTHVDFLIYNMLNKEPILAIEVDGTKYHSLGSRQFERDKLKDNIFEKCGLTLMRFSTDGSMEIDKIDKKLNELLA